jgi:uncharacterized protein
MRRYVLPVLLALAIAGCATQPTHDQKVSETMAATERGDVGGGLAALEAKAPDKGDLLGNLERGELLRIANRYKESLTYFEVADVKVKEWEQTAKTNPEKLMGQIGATILGDASRAYEGQDYEKVMLTTRMALDRVNLNDLDNARVDIKRTHEREAVIAEFRARETAAAEKEAKDKGMTSGSRELNGYPVETLNDPEVLRLKNGYQNALSHYLSGFVYEVLNEPSLAAPGYRNAIELRPNTPILDEALRGLDERTSFRRPRGMTDVLFVLETGSAPARKSQKFTLPIPTGRGVIVSQLTFPVIHPNRSAPVISAVRIGDQTIPAGMIADFNVMARRALKDELPGMIARSAIRAIAKGVIQEAAYRQNALLGIAANIASVATEPPADDRMWRSLPERVFVARGFVKPGTYEMRLLGVYDNANTITVQGRAMIVPVRMFDSKTYFGQAASFGSLGPAVASEPVPVPTSTVGKPLPTKPAPKPAATTSGTPKPAATSGGAPKAAPAAAKPAATRPATTDAATAKAAADAGKPAAAKASTDAQPKSTAAKSAASKGDAAAPAKAADVPSGK